MVAVLFAWPQGVYAGRDDVDLWPESRDARLYAGPHPVVGHPPCDRWCQFAHIHKHKPGKAIGNDGGCFNSCLRAVRTFGGVIEHPANSGAWSHFGLPHPATDGGWVRSLFDPGWSCEVEQGSYGYAAPKATWLYYVGPAPPPLRWGPSGATGRVEFMPSSGPRRSATPPEFAEVLIGLAKMSAAAAPAA